MKKAHEELLRMARFTESLPSQGAKIHVDQDALMARSRPDVTSIAVESCHAGESAAPGRFLTWLCPREGLNFLSRVQASPDNRSRQLVKPNEIQVTRETLLMRVRKQHDEAD